MLWSKNQFTPLPKATQDVWKAFDEENFLLLMGAASQSKSFSVGVKLLLEWVRDPEHSTVKVLGPSEQHLEDNLFSHLVQLHRSSTIPLPGEIGKLFIGLDARSRKSSITGVIIPIGKKSSGRLQGVKRHPRKNPHPIFGPLSRLFIFADEISKIPVGLFRDFDNIMSNVSGVGDRGLKVMGAFNPDGTTGDEVGIRCEPPDGWQSFDIDNHFKWKSKRGWAVVRLDAAHSENVIQKKVIFPGLQTYEGFQQIIRNAGGTNTPGYYSMARGAFPPTGAVLSLIPQGMLNEARALPTWYAPPRPCAGVDLALEGADSARFALGEWGLCTSLKYPPCLKHPQGHTVLFKDERGRNQPRYLLYLKQIFKLPSGDTIQMSTEVIRLCRSTGVSAEWLCVDRTGNGAGTHDMIKHTWGSAIGVNYSESPSETKIMAESSGTCKELFDRVMSELWWASKLFFEFGYLKISPEADVGELFPQLTSRLFRPGKTNKIESKTDWKSRNMGKSPDEADALTLLVHAARMASGVIPGMDVSATDSGDDDEYDEYPDRPRISVDNKFEDL